MRYERRWEDPSERATAMEPPWNLAVLSRPDGADKDDASEAAAREGGDDQRWWRRRTTDGGDGACRCCADASTLDDRLGDGMMARDNDGGRRTPWELLPLH